MAAGLTLAEQGSRADPSARLAPPTLALDPLSSAELRALVLGGENDSDDCERILAQSARIEAALELALGEGLLALLQGDRLTALGFSKLLDYGREILDLAPRTTDAIVQLARELRTRPLLRPAVLAGEVGPRAARTVLPVARGAAEAAWVERARTETVRALEAAVREARGRSEDGQEEPARLRVRLSPGDRTDLDEALELAGRLLPGSSRAERLLAMAQEFLGEHPVEAGDDGALSAGGAFRAGGDPGARDRREGRLEEETDRWSYLPPPRDVPSPALDLGPFSTERELDARLRELAALRRGWDALLGHCALIVRRTGLWRVAGFDSFAHYCRERLGLAPRAVEQRAALEQRLWRSPALRAARDAGLSYERLRLLCDLPDQEVAAWTGRAAGLTVVELRAALADARDAQMRAGRTFRATVPERVAADLQAAFRAVRAVEERLLDDGRCLARVARHFSESWRDHVKRAQTPAQRVRERDRHRCQVPGCSGLAVHGHHVEARSRGGSDHGSNLVGLCAFHHLRAIHGGYLRVRGQAPDGLVWEIGPRHDPVDLRRFILDGAVPEAASSRIAG